MGDETSLSESTVMGSPIPLYAQGRAMVSGGLIANQIQEANQHLTYDWPILH